MSSAGVEPGSTLEPAHQDAIRRITRWLRQPGGRVVFAIGRSPAIREAVLRALPQQPDIISLTADEPRPWRQLIGRSDVLAILHPDTTDGLLQRLNVGREHITRQPTRLVLWLGDLTLMQGVRRAAPDLWAHRAGLAFFLSEADLPLEPVAPFTPLDEQLRSLDERLASWPTQDRVGRFQARSVRVRLLSELGRPDEANAEYKALEKTYKRLRGPPRQQAQAALEEARFRVQTTTSPHLVYERALKRRRSPHLNVRRNAWVESVGALFALQRYPALAQQLDAPPPDDPITALNHGTKLAGLGENLADPVRIQRGLRIGRDTRPKANLGYQEPRYVAQRSGLRATWEIWRGDWLKALTLLHNGAHIAQAAASMQAIAELLTGANVARLAGLPNLAQRWVTRARALALSTGPSEQATVLRAQLLTLDDAERATRSRLVAEAQRALPHLSDPSEWSDLQAAIGIADDLPGARKALEARARKQGWAGFVASRAWAELERHHGQGHQAARASQRALDYARKHGGSALRAGVWADIATGHRLAGEWDLLQTAITSGRAALEETAPDLRPFDTSLQLARETAALHQRQGQAEAAHTALAPCLALARARGLRLQEHEVQLSLCRFGGLDREDAGRAALEIGLESGLLALEANAWLELAALSIEQGSIDLHALERARQVIPATGSREARSRLIEVERLLP